ncbi:MAG: pilus assembly protein PilM [Candidatus Omnitrophota bacterium]
MDLQNVCKKKPCRLLCIDFGQPFIKISFLELGYAGPKPIAYDFKKTGTNEENKAEIITFITAFLKNNSIVKKEVCLSISDPEGIILKHIVLPILPKKEVIEAAKWQFKDAYSIDLADYNVDWQIVDQFVDEQGARKNKVLFVLADKSFVKRCSSLLFECGLKITSISSLPLNYANLLRNTEKEDNLHALLDIGYTGSEICLYKNGNLHFTRRLSFSFNKLIKALAVTVPAGDDRIDLSEAEAEAILLKTGIPQDESQVLDSSIRAIQIISLIRPILEQLIRELKLSLEYYSLNNEQEGPCSISLLGIGSNIENLDRYLSESMVIEIDRVSLPDAGDLKDISPIVNAIGFALSDNKTINLARSEISTKMRMAVGAGLMRILFILIISSFLILFIFAKIEFRNYSTKLNTAKLRLGRIQGVEVLNRSIIDIGSFINSRRQGIVPAEGILKIISALIPAEITLYEIDLNQREQRLIMRGVVALSEKGLEKVLTDFMEKIEKSVFFKEAALLSSVNRESVQEFEIRCDLAG